MEGAAIYRAVFEDAPVAILVLDSEHRVVEANGALLRLLGRPMDDLMKTPVGSLAAPVDADRLARASQEARLAAGQPVILEHRYLAPDGAERWAHTAIRELTAGEGWLVCTLEDVTRTQRALEEQRREAEQDALTGLLNRRGGDRRLSGALQRLVMSGPVAVIICDADGFKQVNDRYGHGAGDRALVTVARRLRRAVRAGDDVARMGGDEFIVVARVANLDEAMIIAERCVRTVAEPTGRSDGPPRVTISAGVAVAFPDRPVDPEQLLAAADRALYEAKRRGGDQWQTA